MVQEKHFISSKSDEIVSVMIFFFDLRQSFDANRRMLFWPRFLVPSWINWTKVSIRRKRDVLDSRCFSKRKLAFKKHTEDTRFEWNSPPLLIYLYPLIPGTYTRFYSGNKEDIRLNIYFVHMHFSRYISQRFILRYKIGNFLYKGKPILTYS